MPSGEVITRLVPVLATATNKPLPYVTDRQLLSSAASAAVRTDHVMPSGEVITLSAAAWVEPTATKRPSPYVTDVR